MRSVFSLPLTASIFSLVFTINLQAQDTKPVLITDRPDQTESSATVPFRSFQIETGFVMENKDNGDYSFKTFAYNTTLLRYGLLENMELRLGFEYLGDQIKDKLTDNQETYSGFSPLYAGFKIKVAEEKGLIPEIAFLGAMILPFTASVAYKPSYPAPNMRFAFSHTITNRVSIGYNLGAEWDGDSAVPAYFYSIAMGVGITDNLGAFIESYGLLPEENGEEHLLDMGFTYLIAPNVQLDLSGGIGLNQETIDNFISAGITIRLPD